MRIHTGTRTTSAASHLRSIGLVFAIGLACIGYAQLQVLPVGNAKWVDGFWIGPGYPYDGWSYTMNTADEDTIVNGIPYERIVASQAYAIRDDGFGKVYFLIEGDDTERLLYDFDVIAGNTIRYDNEGQFYFDSLYVVVVDTIQVNGTDRRRIGVTGEFGSAFPSQYWIQGVGSDGGLFNPWQGPSVSGTSWLACMSVDGIVQFGGNVGEEFDCDIYLGQLEVKPAPPLMVAAPNPGNSFLRVELNGVLSTVASLRSFDAQGRNIGTWPMLDRTITLETGTWPAGVYLIECTVEDQPPQRKRWIKD